MALNTIIQNQINHYLCYLCLFADKGDQLIVLLYVFMFLVPCCDVRYDFYIKAMFGTSLPPVICRRAHVLFVAFVYIGVQYFVLLSVFTFLVPCCDVHYDFRMKTVFGSSLPQLFVGGLMSYFFTFVCVYWCPIFCAIIYRYVLSFVLRGPLQSPYKNNVWFVSPPPFICRRAYVLFMLFVFVFA